MKIYVASSWRNMLQPEVVTTLRGEGHDVYDFRNPPSSTGFSWSEIDPNWKNWTQEEYLKALGHWRAIEGYDSDMQAMKDADVGVLVLGAGDSAHLELGWFAGQPDKLAIVLFQPEYDDEAAIGYLRSAGHTVTGERCGICKGGHSGCRLALARTYRMVAVRMTPREPELMYKMADYLCLTIDEVIHALNVEAVSFDGETMMPSEEEVDS